MAEKPPSPPISGYEYEQYAPKAAYKEGMERGKIRLAVVEPSDSAEDYMNLRHGHAAAHAARVSAELAIGQGGKNRLPAVSYIDSDVYVVSPVSETSRNIVRMAYSEEHKKLDHIDVVSLSYHNPKAYPNITLDMFKGIIVHGEGNDGSRFLDMQSELFSHFQPAHHAVGVGAATRAENGTLQVEDYSRHSGPTILAISPFIKEGGGLTYRYLPTDREFRDNKLAPIEDAMRKEAHAEVMQHFATEKAKKALKEGESPEVEQQIKRITGLETKYSNDSTFRKQVDEEIEKRFTAAKELSLEKGSLGNELKKWQDEKQKTATDAEGFAHNLRGTSFAAPWVAGQLAAQKELHPSLSNDELIAALTVSAVPVTRIRDDYATIAHITTATGRTFDPVYSGFGVLDEEAFAKNATLMEEIKRSNPSLSTKEERVAVDLHPLSSNVTEEQRCRYVLVTPSGKDITAINTDIELTGPFKETPEYIFVTSPSGTRMQVAVAHDDNNVVTVNTDGFLGEKANGAWAVETPENAIVTSIRLNVRGVERGGVIDKFLEKAPIQQVQPERATETALPEKPETKPEVKPEAAPAPKSIEPSPPQANVTDTVGTPLAQTALPASKPEFDQLLAEVKMPSLPITPGPSLPAVTNDMPSPTTGNNLPDNNVGLTV